MNSLALPDTLADTLGAEHIQTDPAALAEAAIDSVTPSLMVQPGDDEAVAATLAWANSQGLSVIPRGAGTTLGLGEPPRRADLVLDLSRLNRVLEYEPADLTVTVQAGVTLGQLQQALGERRQWLPLDPPGGADRTVGGLVATGASGPHRLAFGTPRDLLIGLRIAQADGMLYRGGAKVVKNVAGYDLPKLFVGSLGTLGVVVEATFKLQPLPRRWGTVAVVCPSLEAAGHLAGQVLTSSMTPAALCILDMGAVRQTLFRVPDLVPPDTETLLLARFGGIPPAVERQLRELGQLAERVGGAARSVEADAELWAALADLPLDMTARRALRFKNAVLPSRVADAMRAAQAVARDHGLPVGQIAYAGNGVVLTTMRGFGAEEGLQARLTQAGQALRERMADLGGTSVVEHGPTAVKTAIGVWEPTRSDFRLMQALKAQFDPQGTLNPGRFVGGI